MKTVINAMLKVLDHINGEDGSYSSGFTETKAGVYTFGFYEKMQLTVQSDGSVLCVWGMNENTAKEFSSLVEWFDSERETIREIVG